MLIGRVIEECSNDPYYNLALEHAILYLHPKNDYSSTLRFWKNPESIIIGRSQVVEEEADLRYCEDHEIRVCRRISGGGAVYNDFGNINISIFYPRKKAVSAEGIHAFSTRFTGWLAESIRNTGFTDVEVEGFYNVMYGGRKVSGAAAYFSKEWLLHHATLLVSANLDNLERSLIHRYTERKTRKSNYQPTANLVGLPVEQWKVSFTKLLEIKLGITFEKAQVSREEHDLANMLKVSMYSQDSWLNGGKRLDEPFNF